MANKKKNASANPNLDTVKDVFRKNRHITNRIQQKTVFEATDLSEKYYARRIKAVMHLLPEMKKRYAAKYPEMDMVSEFAEAASFPSITYDIIDWQMDVCLGAAVWLLDRIWEQEKMQQLCDLLPKEDDGAELPVIYDTRFSEELLGRTKNVVANRYGEGERHIIPPTFFDRREGADTFHAVLALVPDEVKKQAAAHLKQKFWEWADRYFEGLYPIIREQKRLEKKLERIHREIDELSVQKLQQKKPAALPFASPDMLAANTLMSGTAKEVLQIGRQLAELEEALDDVSDRLSDYRFTIFQINLMGKQDALDSMEEKHAEAMRHFPIDDPYELCFALLYLLDADDDFVWVYSFMTGVACRAAYMLPWSIETYDEAYDGFWFDEDAWIQPQPLDSAWYEQNYIGDEDLEDDIVSDVSLAQLVYQSTGALLPRDMQRFDSGVKWLRRKGLKPSQASMLCAVMNILGEASRQQKYLPDGTTAETSPIEPAAAEQAAEENAQLKRELTQLKAQMKKINHDLSQENAILQDKLSKAEKASAAMAQELADLREIVFNQQRSVPQEKEEPAKIAFPYRTDRRVIAFGGHDSWLRAIKFKVPDVRFMGEDISSAEVIRRADVVWIQTNCIGHNTYYNVIDLVRRYGRKVRYFKYASAVKCAEQVAEEEKKSKA